jgi:hypothetical protein
MASNLCIESKKRSQIPGQQAVRPSASCLSGHGASSLIALDLTLLGRSALMRSQRRVVSQRLNDDDVVLQTLRDYMRASGLEAVS